MKKIFTLVVASFLTIASFAADHKPSVSVKTMGNYEVVIDGRSYFGQGLVNLSLSRSSQHSIQVYQKSSGRIFASKRKKLVSSTSFSTGRNDIDIIIDFRGQISIDEHHSGYDQWDNHNDKKGGDFDRGKEKSHRF